MAWASRQAATKGTTMAPWGIRVRIHRAIVVPFVAACREAHAISPWRPLRIDSYACRTVRGGASHSLHAWALAHDWFATPPGVVPPGGVWTPVNSVPHDFAGCFTRRGFTWGRYFSRPDVPHIEWAGPAPTVTPPAVPGQALTILRHMEDAVPLTVIEVPVKTSAADRPNAGCGWEPVPYRRDAIVGFTGPGLRPGVDRRYETASVGFAAEGERTIGTVEGWAPGAVATVQITVAT